MRDGGGGVSGDTFNGHAKVVRLAHAAYQAALEMKWAKAVRYIQRIGDECGGEGVTTALVAWCDAYLDHAVDGVPEAAVVGNVAFIQGETGQLDKAGSERVPDEIQWAGRAVKARAELDHEAWLRALDEIPTDERQVGVYVLALLRVVATSVNGLPRGFARMGRS